MVTAINITNAGSGYTSAPTVVIGSPTSNAPVFNAFNVLPDATVVLYRNNQEVSRVNLTAGGTVSIADLNGSTQPGQNPIPDGVYVYRVQQIDAAGNPSPLSSGLTVTIDHTPPVTPFPPVLEAASDTSKGLDETSKNNSSSPQNAPVFDVAQVEQNATVFLYRAPVASCPRDSDSDAHRQHDHRHGQSRRRGLHIHAAGHALGRWRQRCNGQRHRDERRGHRDQRHQRGSGYTSAPTVTISSVGTFAQVNKVNAPAGGTVPIADINNGQGPIPDGSYIYEAQQFDLAGNPSPITTPSTTITIDTATPVGPVGPAPRPEQRHRRQQPATASRGSPSARSRASTSRGSRGSPPSSCSGVVDGTGQHPGPGREPGRTTEPDARSRS